MVVLTDPPYERSLPIRFTDVLGVYWILDATILRPRIAEPATPHDPRV
jgi:hypothetical protein